MDAFRIRKMALAAICLCSLSAGCVTTYENSQASFTHAAPGEHGQSTPDVPSAEGKSWFAWPWSKKKLKPKTLLAYAHWEESRANQAATRNDREEQRAALAAARQSYEKVLKADDKSIDAIIGLARLDQVAERTQEAEQGFLKAVRLSPQSGQTHNALGQFYADQKRWPEATQELQKAMAAAPENKSFQFHYAIALANSGQVDAARPLLVDAVGVAAAHYNLGVILYEKGDRTRSEQEFVAAVAENPQLEQARDWLDVLRREPQQLASNPEARPLAPEAGRVIPVAATAPRKIATAPAAPDISTGPADAVTANHEVVAPDPVASRASVEAAPR